MKQFPTYIFTVAGAGRTVKDIDSSLVWCRVEPIEKKYPEQTTWIPAFQYSDGRIESVLGSLTQPDSCEDLRKFTDCPFEGYAIEETCPTFKNPEYSEPMLCSVLAMLHPKDMRPFIYQVEIPVNPSLNDRAQERAIMEKLRQMIVGKYGSIRLLRWKIFMPFAHSSYPCNETGHVTQLMSLEEMVAHLLEIHYHIDDEPAELSCYIVLNDKARQAFINPSFLIKQLRKAYPTASSISIINVSESTEVPNGLPLIIAD